MVTEKKQIQDNKGIRTAVHVTMVTVITSTPVFLSGAANNLIRKDIGLGTGAIGILFSLYWMGSLFGSYISRRNNSSLSIDKSVGLSVLITSIALTLMCIYPQVGMWLGAMIGGVVYGYSQPYTNFLLMRRCSTSIQGFAFGLKQAAIPAATLLCSLAIPVIAVPLGWRNLFGLIALFAFIYAILALIFSRNSVPEEKNTSKINKLPLNWHLSMLALVGALGAMIGNSLGGFLITSLTHGGFALVTASLIAAIASISNIFVRVIAGIVTDRTNVSPPRLLVFMFIIGVVGTILLTRSSHPAQIIGAILAYGGGWGWAGLLHYVTGLAYPRREKQATAVSQMGVSIGAASGPLLFGWLFSVLDSTQAWWIVTIAGLLACLAVLASRWFEPTNQKKNLKKAR